MLLEIVKIMGLSRESFIVREDHNLAPCNPPKNKSTERDIDGHKSLDCASLIIINWF